MGRWVVSLALLGACSTPRQAMITGGSMMVGSAVLVGGVLAARDSPPRWGEPDALPVVLVIGLPTFVIGSILLLSGIAAAADSK